MTLNDILKEEKNIAKELEEEQLTKIGQEVCEGFDNDIQSRAHWEEDIKDYLKLAMQICETKTFPWPGAANVKYPLIATASMQFNARAYPTLVPSNNKLVQVAVKGQDPDQKKMGRAQRVSSYMSNQILNEMPEWEENMDNLLLILPIFGIGFKKVYYDPSISQNCAKLVHPFNFVVNYWATDLDNCFRQSEVIYKDKREVTEKKRAGLYLDVDLGEATVDENFKERINVSKNQTPSEEHGDAATPYTLIEQHTFLDLDDDGYSEPYVVLVDYNSKKVLRITARYGPNDIKYNEDGEVETIKATNYYIKYSFIPSPDGSFYTRGFGHLLGPLNKTADTLLNQLIDAGTLSNLQSGYIGKGLKLRPGDNNFKPGEWKQVNSLGQDIKANIFPLPVRDPSEVLFKLLGMVLQSGKELASVAEIFVGKMPGQNTPAYTTQQTIEQGMKLFTAIYKRVYRSMTKEFKMLFRLNQVYLDEQDYKEFLDDQAASKADFEIKDKDLSPTADPSAASDFEKQQKIQQAQPFVEIGTIDPKVLTAFTLKTLGFSDTEIQQLTEGAPANQPTQPNPEEQKMQMEMEAKQAEAQTKIQLQQAMGALKQQEAQFKMIMAQQEQAMNMKFEKQRLEFEQQAEEIRTALQMKRDETKHQFDLKAADEKHKQQIKNQPKAPKKPTAK